MSLFGLMLSFAARSFTTTAPRIEISRVETESDIVGFAGAAGAAVGAPTAVTTGLAVPICTCGRESFMDTEEKPARWPPTRVEAGRCGAAGRLAAGAAGAAGQGPRVRVGLAEGGAGSGSARPRTEAGPRDPLEGSLILLKAT